MSRLAMKHLGLAARPKLSVDLTYRLLYKGQFACYFDSKLDSIYNEFNSKVNGNPRERRTDPNSSETPRRKKKEVQLSDQQHASLAEYVEEVRAGKGPRSFNPVREKPRPQRSEKSSSSYETYVDWMEKKTSGVTTSADRNDQFFAQLAAWETSCELDQIQHAPPSERGKREKKVTRNQIPSAKAVNYCSEEIPLAIVPSSEQTQPPHLQHDLDRALFSPGVHVLKDERTNIYNFPSYLEPVMSVRDFDFSKVPATSTPFQDKSLSQLAFEQKKTFATSATTVAPVLTQLHFLLSKNRPPSGISFSRSFQKKSVNFFNSAKKPVSLFLRWNTDTETYLLESDKAQENDFAMKLVDQVLESKLTTPNDVFETFSQPPNNSGSERPNRTYTYSTCGDFVLRSQTACYDSRLPGTGTFDVRFKAANTLVSGKNDVEIKDGHIGKLKGLVGSYEREMYDLVCSKLFVYALEARIGRKDGIFLTYHNGQKLFGFEYLPLEAMDRLFHSIGYGYNPNTNNSLTNDQITVIADEELRLSMSILSDTLNQVVKKFPKQSVNILLKASGFQTENDTDGAGLVLLANPMPEESIRSLQQGVELGPRTTSPNFSNLSSVRKYLNTHTLLQASNSGYMGEYPNCAAWRVITDNIVDGIKLPSSQYPAPQPGKKWVVEASTTPIPPINIPLQVQLMCKNSQAIEPVPARVIALAERFSGSMLKNGDKDDVRKQAQDDIADLVERQLAVTGNPVAVHNVFEDYADRARRGGKK